MLVIAIALALSIPSFAQYEYLNFRQEKDGASDNAKIAFSWTNHPDSAAYYNAKKFRDLLGAIQIFETKGFELVTINEYGPGSLVIIVSVYMRRKKNR